ncbi:MAG: L,D-transpeptidase [Lachnospiraceae bacterium]|nr:L,D-transpeptidase [Lachnospiraceae bacterium]
MIYKMNRLYDKKFLTFIFLICFAGVFFSGCSRHKTDAQKNVGDLRQSSSSVIEEASVENNLLHETSSAKDNTANTQTKKKVKKKKKELTEKDYEKLIDFDAEHPFVIKVNRTNNYVCIYGIDKNGRYSIPYKIFRCSVGLYEGSTPVGCFFTSDKYEWRMMVDYSYAQYAIRINGPIMLHSVPYNTARKNDLEVDQFNLLGEPASLGCIRLSVADIKWIYDNCPDRTQVVIYDNDKERAPLKLPKKLKAVSAGEYAGWDPTDPDTNNPYNK